MYLMAVDLGYGNLKRASGNSSGQPRIEVWPACTVKQPSVGSKRERDRYGDVIVEKKRWRVGLNPEDAGPAAAEILHRDYVGSEPWQAQLLYALTHNIDTPKRIDRLILGLPVDEWLDPDLRERPAIAAEALLKDSPTRLPIVECIGVIPQPVGAYLAANERAKGKLLKHNTLVIDAGHNTLDWIFFRLGRLQGNSKGSGTTRIGGIAHIVEGLAKHLYKTEGACVSEWRIRAALEDGSRLLVHGRERDLYGLISDVRDKVVKHALRSVQRSLRYCEEDMDDVVLTGGGAAMYRPAIERLFPHSRLYDSDNNACSNVYGLWLYGRYAKD